MPKISVIMPFYNAAGFIGTAIESILNQTFPDFELILINDASTDNSDYLVKKYLVDSRIVYLKNNEQRGIVVNLNKGLELAKAEIIARMDGDDISKPERFKRQYEFLEKNPHIDIVGCNVEIIDEQGRVIDRRTKPDDPEFIAKNILVYSPVVHPSVMFRKSAIVAAGGYRENYPYNEDLDLWYRLSALKNKFSNVNEYLFCYRYHKNSTAFKARQNAKNLFYLRCQAAKSINAGPIILIQIYLQYAIGFIFSGRIRQKIEGIYKLIRYGKK